MVGEKDRYRDGDLPSIANSLAAESFAKHEV